MDSISRTVGPDLRGHKRGVQEDASASRVERRHVWLGDSPISFETVHQVVCDRAALPDGPILPPISFLGFGDAESSPIGIWSRVEASWWYVRRTYHEGGKFSCLATRCFGVKVCIGATLSMPGRYPAATQHFRTLTLQGTELRCSQTQQPPPHRWIAGGDTLWRCDLLHLDR